jgi:8-oxo-dGTP pyrophosphatase MutT (NUDIX family)
VVSRGRGCDDQGELAAALRESHEEIGIHPSHVKVLGRLDQVTAAYDFVVTPFIVVIPPFYEFRLNPAETDAVFSVPIASLLEPKCVTIADHLSSHGEPVYHFYCNGWDIWGATARIIVQFLDLVYGYGLRRFSGRVSGFCFPFAYAPAPRIFSSTARN